MGSLTYLYITHTIGPQSQEILVQHYRNQSRCYLMGDDHYDHPLCPGLQPGPPSQTPGGLGQRYWSVGEVTWPPKSGVSEVGVFRALQHNALSEKKYGGMQSCILITIVTTVGTSTSEWRHGICGHKWSTYICKYPGLAVQVNSPISQWLFP